MFYPQLIIDAGRRAEDKFVRANGGSPRDDDPHRRSRLASSKGMQAAFCIFPEREWRQLDRLLRKCGKRSGHGNRENTRNSREEKNLGKLHDGVAVGGAN